MKDNSVVFAPRSTAIVTAPESGIGHHASNITKRLCSLEAINKMNKSSNHAARKTSESTRKPV